MKYIKRIVDKQLELRLNALGATLIVGPKWCGKTTTAQQFAKSTIKLNDIDMREKYLTTAKIKPSNLLIGEKPRLIDEWQEAPTLWDAVRTSVDEIGLPGQYILTGSTVVQKDNIMHSGTGRISRLMMYPMSLYESGESNGKISLTDLFNNKVNIDGIEAHLDINAIIFAACRGGWPSSLQAKTKEAQLFIANDYIENICEVDISNIDKIDRSPSKTRLLLKSYARNLATLAKNDVILSDITVNENMSLNSFLEYMNALKRLFVFDEIEAWCPSIRSKTAIRSGIKRMFIDPSLAVASLGLSPDYLQVDLKTFGFIFENLVIRDLKVYSSSLNGKISYYHDRYDLEADCVLHLNDGRYALIEIKLGSQEIEKGAQHLLKIKQLIQEYNMKEKQCKLREPDLLIVITGGAMAYEREDGVKIIPISCLRD